MFSFLKMTSSHDHEFQDALAEFVGAFETVFHHDWEYAKSMIGDEVEGCTFIEPGLADEVEDWGARGALLEKYRRLRSLMDAKGIQSKLPFSIPHIREFKKRHSR
jgi:hypothetical protein